MAQATKVPDAASDFVIPFACIVPHDPATIGA